MAIQTLYPNIEPSLNLSFALTKTLDPRITFTRTTTGVFYNGVTTAKAEENLLTESQSFENAAGGTLTANAVSAPNGTTTATSFVEDNTTGTHLFSSVGATTFAATPYTFSFFAKPNGRSWIVLRMQGVNRAWFDVTNGVVGTLGAGVTASIQASADGYYRCIATFTPTAGAANLFFRTGTADNTDSYTGDGVSGVYVWGAQLEQRSAVTAYTPTTTQPITNYIPVLLTAAAGVARFDHNPITGESLGLLVEEQRTNLLTYSDDFANAAWTKTRSSITSNTIVAPDGTLTGDKFVEDTTASNTHLVLQSVSGTTNTNPYTASVYVKAGERSSLNIQLQEGSPFTRTVIVVFDIASASVGTITESGGATGTSGTITAVGNGWYRCSVTTTLGGSTGSIRTILLLNNGTTSSYTGDGYSGIYIWGAQLEAGAFPTSYIPTVASTVTRNSDIAFMTGTNFSSWYNASEGTLYAQAMVSQLGQSGRLITFDDGSSNNQIDLTFTGTNSSVIESVVAGVYGGNVGTGTVTANTPHKIAATYSISANETLSFNGGAAASGNITFPSASLNRMYIGRQSNAAVLNGTIRRIAYYPSRLSNAQLQALTT
jgi:hypothetical protein